MTSVESTTTTPALADLEQVIERGLQSFIEVGNALVQIKIGKRYREAGYSTFEDYCSQRWGITRRQGNRLVAAAATHEALSRALPESSETGPTGPILPTTERQARPLTSLPDDRKFEAWHRAVDSAGGEQPTAAQVAEAVHEVTVDLPPTFGSEPAADHFDHDPGDFYDDPDDDIVDAEVVDETPAPTVTGMDGKSYPVKPKPKPLGPDEPYDHARAIADANRRHAKALERLISDWPYLADFRNHPDRDLILGLLCEPDREQLALIESSLK